MAPLNSTRREFIKSSSLGMAALAMPSGLAVEEGATKPAQTTIPRWRGFNLLDFFSPKKPVDSRAGRHATTEDDLRWMADWGFDFVRSLRSWKP